VTAAAAEGETAIRNAAELKSHGDHRIAMAMAVAGLVAEGETTINGFFSGLWTKVILKS